MTTRHRLATIIGGAGIGLLAISGFLGLVEWALPGAVALCVGMRLDRQGDEL
jgi:hypothetical protein